LKLPLLGSAGRAADPPAEFAPRLRLVRLLYFN
jgi:hypothetical protein